LLLKSQDVVAAIPAVASLFPREASKPVRGCCQPLRVPSQRRTQ
jgi:hypothetical protein